VSEEVLTLMKTDFTLTERRCLSDVNQPYHSWDARSDRRYTWDQDRCRWCGKWKEPLMEKVWEAIRK